MLYAARSHIGLVRQMNEDGYAVHMDWRPMSLLMVADGMGGQAAGEVASRMAIDTVAAVVRDGLQQDPVDASDLLRRAVAAANDKICAAARTTQAYLGMGTTLVAALIDAQQVVFAHVGDSRGYLFQQGELRQITADHSLVAELVRSGQLTEEEAKYHPQRNIVTRSLGSAAHGQSDINVVRWQPGDGLLLCTDGLSGVVSDADLAETMRQLCDARTSGEVERLADHLVELALERGGPDNITLVLAAHREEDDG
ncbi:MAG: Stp1/IreP family PP2C-type Ser/Thr phosphatase [Alicyclobacillaceae bacterium]|nr:Stp1/IreP family PP2C-type Ser/Thr phosphatase [Alicyclobacillaceae bacterium]